MWLGLFLVFLPAYLTAQNIDTNNTELRTFAQNLTKKQHEDRAVAFAMAANKGWTTFKTFKNGRVRVLKNLDESGRPLYLSTENNTYAAATTKADKLYQGGTLGLSLSGSSTALESKVAVWDGGKIYTSHQEFGSNRIIISNGGAEVSDHATHVAGTIMAAGVNPVAKGMAFGLNKLKSYDFDNDDSEMANEGANLLVSNHSYGFIAGWDYNQEPDGGGAARWEWNGVMGAFEDYKFGLYDSNSRSWDQICYLSPYYLPVKSAGNNRNDNGPAIGGEYYIMDNSGQWVSRTRQANDISNNDAYDTLPLTSNAKNILTVGAIYGAPYVNSTLIAPFSSWGPTDDGRIKPDIVGKGIALTSTISTNPTAYASYSGTSMSTPNVSGTLVLLQEAYHERNGVFMRSATLKGLAIHTADDLGNAGPDYVYGWGLLNAEKAAQVILGDGTSSRIIETKLNQTTTQTFKITASGSGPLVVTICWTDPPGQANNSGVLDQPTSRLINDLDLRITNQTLTYRPWILDPANPENIAVTGDNSRDNVEQVLINNPTAGQVYTITISNKGTLVGPNSTTEQSFSLIMSGGTPEFYVPYDNFKVSTRSETCRSQNDGKINIQSKQKFNYTATLYQYQTALASYNFTSALSINNLSAGVYKLCITVSGQPAYNQCFDLQITEPEDLSAYVVTNQTNNTVQLNMNGSTNYQIVLNGDTLSSSSDEVVLNLKNGPNTLQVSTDKLCQGTYETTIYVSDRIMVFPNPFESVLNISLGDNESPNTWVSVFDSYGQMVYKQLHNSINGNIQLDLARLKKGFYYLKLNTGSKEIIHKILKK